MCRTVEFSREAQRGAAHHLGYRTMNVFLRGCPGAQQNQRKGVRPESVDVGLLHSARYRKTFVQVIHTHKNGLGLGAESHVADPMNLVHVLGGWGGGG